jgi:hypothetical protein
MTESQDPLFFLSMYVYVEARIVCNTKVGEKKRREERGGGWNRVHAR